MADSDISDGAVRKGTGHGWDHWFSLLDPHGLTIDHTERARRLTAAAPELSGWWVQMVTVQFERERGLRVEGQTSQGDYQFNCSKATDLDPSEAYERLVTTPFLPGADWRRGSVWESEGGRAEVRRADPGKMLRWFWWDADGRSKVEVSFPSTASGKTSVVFVHSGLTSLAARDAYRARWKAALERILSP